jgi:hypothetical protein
LAIFFDVAYQTRMPFSTSTSNLLSALERLSRNRLTRREDLGILLDLAREQEADQELEELSFQAKFAARAFGIMKRIGSEGEGYPRLSAEFTSSLEKVRMLTSAMLERAEPEVRSRMSSIYLAMTPVSLDHLLALLHDLSWYKNWRIDHPGESPWEIKPE